MPRQVGIAVENNFIKGLVTEATGLKFPENASTETYNCVYDTLGTVRRRLGFDYEASKSNYTEDFTGKAITTFVWKNVAQEGDLTYVVRQAGDSLHFYRVAADTALSAGKHATVINLTTFIPSGSTLSTVATLECQYASGNGTLFVTNPKLESFYVTYNATLNTFTATAITLQARDFEGDSVDALAVDNRPTAAIGAITAAHRYNLQNQGWSTANLTAWDTARTDMPSNADVPWYFKSATNAFDFTIVDNITVGNSKAPTGHYFYNLYKVTRTTNFAGATDFAITDDRAATCAFFAGRVFYAGIRYQGYNSKIYFSQIVEAASQYGLCYQANDPTAELSSDLLASDGGFVDLIEAGNILKMVPILNTLLVFCTNGVWAITGSQGSGFAANDYAVSKLSDVANVSHCSFVVAEGSVYWWTDTGIYTVTRDPQTNALAVNSITKATIQTFYEDIPLEGRSYARGVYDSLNKRVQWIFRSSASGSFTAKYQFDRILNMSTLTGAFYPWSVDISSVKLTGIICVTGAGGSQVANQVVDGSNTIQSSANNVVVFQSTNSSVDAVVKYLTSTGTAVTFAEEYKTTYLDWSADYSSYFITGYKLRGEGIRKHQTNYIRLYSDNEQASSFTVQAIWDYAIDRARGRYSDVQAVVQSVVMSDPTNYGIKSKRLKIRGHGLACQLYFNSVEGQPFDIIGWVSMDSVNQKP